MITRLTLTNWRTYEHADLELGEGTTFVVAANGVGKTSLILAAAWGLLGDASGVDGRAAIRTGSDHSEVAIAVELHDGSCLRIERTVKLRGRAAVEPFIDGSPITERKALSLLGRVFGIEPRILGQLAFMLGGGHLAAEEFSLRDHLYRAFGVSNLLDSATAADHLAKDARAAREELRKVERKQQQGLETIHAELADFDRELEELAGKRRQLELSAEKADKRLREGQRWTDYEATTSRRSLQVEGALRKVAQLLSGLAAEHDATIMLEEAERDTQFELDQTTQTLAAERARMSVTQEAIERLENAQAFCPTCLRPLSPREAETAIHHHDVTVNEAEQRAAKLNDLLKETRERLAEIKSTVRRISALPAPPTPPASGRVDLKDAVRRHKRAIDELRTNDVLIADLKARRDHLARDLRADEEARAAETNISIAYRREAVSVAMASALKKTADAIIAERIDPLTSEVAWRWKRLFGSDDLVLRPNGQIFRQMGDREIKFAELSGGEKIWALLVTRLLVVGASTRVPFIWLDEPLEHLDPKLRRTVAGSLIRASTHSSLRQVIVTTYEYDLARQLSEDAPNSRLIVLRAGA